MVKAIILLLQYTFAYFAESRDLFFQIITVQHSETISVVL